MMAAGTRGELCNVCEERFDEETHDPVALMCGHSFCRTCLVHLHNTRSPLQCPNCKKVHEGSHPKDLPKNFQLLKIIRNIPENPEEVETVHQNKNDSCKETDSSSNSSSDSSDSDSKKEEKKVKKLKDNKRKGNGKKKPKEEGDKGKGRKENIPEPESKDECGDIVIDIDPPEGEGAAKPKFVIHPKTIKGKGIMWLAILIFAVFGGIFAIHFIAPQILKDIGFSSRGIVKGSHAAYIQSQRDKALQKNETLSDDYITQNFKWFQKTSMNGFDSWINFLIFSAGFIVFFMVGFGIAYLLARYRHNKDLSLGKKEQDIALTQASENPATPLVISGTVT